MAGPFQTKSAHEMRFAPAARLKMVDAQKGTIEGYGSVFGVIDSYGEVVAPGAFTESLAEHKAAGTRPVMLWQHRQDEPLGRWTELEEDERGLRVAGQINLGTSKGKDAYEHIVQGDISGMSIGYWVRDSSYDEVTGIRTLKRVDLVEVSVVSFPANTSARISGAKNLASKGDLIGLLKEGGLSNAAAKRVAAGGWAALTGEDDTKIKELAALVEKATANLRSTK